MTKGNEIHFDNNIVQRVTVAVGNPRKVGKHYFRTDDGVAGQRESSTDTEVWDQAVVAYVFARLSDSARPFLPVYPKKYSRFGTFGQVHEEWREYSPEERLTADKTWIEMPLHESIDEYILVLRSASEPTGWRVATVPASEVSTDRQHQIPDLLELPELSEDPNAEMYRELLAKHECQLD